MYIHVKEFSEVVTGLRLIFSPPSKLSEILAQPKSQTTTSPYRARGNPYAITVFVFFWFAIGCHSPPRRPARTRGAGPSAAEITTLQTHCVELEDEIEVGAFLGAESPRREGWGEGLPVYQLAFRESLLGTTLVWIGGRGGKKQSVPNQHPKLSGTQVGVSVWSLPNKNDCSCVI